MDRVGVDAPFGDGGCACGALRFRTSGQPLRVGICHCMDCRKAHGAAFNSYAIFDASQVEVRGEVREWHGPSGYAQGFCPSCGAQVSGRGEDDEIGLALGSFDQPGRFEPQYELWVVRREPWLAPLDVPQYAGNLPDEDAIGLRAASDTPRE